MWARAGRPFLGVFILVVMYFGVQWFYNNGFNTNVITWVGRRELEVLNKVRQWTNLYGPGEFDQIVMTEDQLRVLRAFNPSLVKEGEQVQLPNLAKGVNPAKARSDALLQHLRNTCTNFNISFPVNDFMLSHMHFDHERKAIYCFIPKVACTSWKRIWMKITGLVKPDKDLSEIDRYVIHTSIPSLTSQKDKLPDIMANYKKFLFIRHPFSRVLSAFRDKIEHEDPKSGYNFHREIGKKIQKKYRPVEKVEENGHNTTFPEFIRFISEPGRGTYEQRNEHWLSVHEICNPCGVQYDFIGKYETLKEDADYVIDWLGISNLVDKFPESARSFHAKRFDPKYFNQLTHEDKMGFFKKYLTDFVGFNYTFL